LGDGDGVRQIRLGLAQVLPDLLRDVGHERVQQAQADAQHLTQRFLGGGAASRVLGAKDARLDGFEVPVAEFAPEELLDGARRFAQLELFQLAADVAAGGEGPGADPALGEF